MLTVMFPRSSLFQCFRPVCSFWKVRVGEDLFKSLVWGECAHLITPSCLVVRHQARCICWQRRERRVRGGDPADAAGDGGSGARGSRRPGDSGNGAAAVQRGPPHRQPRPQLPLPALLHLPRRAAAALSLHVSRVAVGRGSERKKASLTEM